MKNLILIVLTCLFSSCGKSVYYAYYVKDENDHQYSYCTLEITPKKEIIYRASSDKYLVYPNTNNLYVYIYSDKDAAEISENYYDFGATLSELWFIKANDVSNLKMELNAFLYSDPTISYRIEENDTITCITDLEYLKKSRGFKESGVLWFPEYMVKVDQIDYNKFYKQVHHMDLKNPRKTKN
ncbi:MAG TPA: hypothetical protein VF677_10615 [Flavobacterium sp.]